MTLFGSKDKSDIRLRNSKQAKIAKAKSDKPMRRKQLAGIGVRLLMAILFCLVITSLTLDLPDIDFDLPYQLLVSAVVIVTLAAVTWFWQAVLITLGTASAVILILRLTEYSIWEKIQEIAEYPSYWLEEAFYWLISEPNSFPIETLNILGLVIGSLVALGCYWLVARTCHPWLMLFSISGLLIARQALTIGFAPFASFFGILLVFTALAMKQPGWGRKIRPALISLQPPLSFYSLLPAVSALVIAGILSMALSPAIITSAKRPQDLENLTSMLIIPGLNSPGSGGEFSIGTAGYYPLHNRLGGPVTLSSDPVFSLTGTASDMLLKGAVSLNYSGNSWTRLEMDETRDFNNEMWRQNREEVFGANELSEIWRLQQIEPNPSFLKENEFGIIAELVDDEGMLQGPSIQTDSYQIRLSKQGIRSIFIQGSPMEIILTTDYGATESGFDLFSDIMPFDKTVYYNSGGALYTSRPFSPGHSYNVLIYKPEIDENSFPYWYRMAFGINTSDLDFNAEDLSSSVGDRKYLQIPNTPEYASGSILHDLTMDLISGHFTQYERAEAIRMYLKNTASYSLNVEFPPEDREFVSWFLEQGEGYCVYFATALTMMCRLAGIPARYVEGYYIPPAEIHEYGVNDPEQLAADLNERVITGEQAHAWTEIYLDGVGWLPMDATPGGGEAAAQLINQGQYLPEPQETSIPEQYNQDQNTDGDQSNEDNQVDTWSRFIYRFADIILPLLIILAILGVIIFIIYKKLLRLRKILYHEWWTVREPNVRLRIKLLLNALLRLLPEKHRIWEHGQVWSNFADNSRHYIFSVSNGTIDAHEWEKASHIINEALYSDHAMKESKWEIIWHVYSNMTEGLRKTKRGRMKLYFSLISMLIHDRRSGYKH